MDEERKAVIPQVLRSWEYLVAAGVVSICLVIILVSIDYGERIGWISAALMGGTILIAIGNLMWRGLMKIVAGPEGVSAGGRQIAAEDIRTIIRIYEHRRTGESFIVLDPRIRLENLGDVQSEVVALLSGTKTLGEVSAEEV